MFTTSNHLVYRMIDSTSDMAFLTIQSVNTVSKDQMDDHIKKQAEHALGLLKWTVL
jgi:hypothetical protein